MFVPRSREIGTVLVGLIPAPVMYRSLETVSSARKKHKVNYSLPIAIGSPLTPRSPRPRIREPDAE